jgi:Holliday junction resolvasome RuvABC ATP-dependent DNA helicase subunit
MMESRPTTTDANRLARDIESLVRDCEHIALTAFLADIDKDDAKRKTQRAMLGFMAQQRNCTAAGVLMYTEFFQIACWVCNADQSVSQEEALLFRELFVYLNPNLKDDLPRNDPQNAYYIRTRNSPFAFVFDGQSTPFAWRCLLKADQANGTAWAGKYREALLRTAKMFAAAEGVQNERKLLFVAQIEKTLAPLPAASIYSAVPKRAEDSPVKTVVAAPHSLDALFGELNALIGLTDVKSEVAQLANYIKIQQLRKQQGLRVPEISLHMVFYGNPGTGKTTVARLLARIYQALGVLSKGQLVETDRSGLVAGYVGQTALKVREVVLSAIGGVLFIDEAYSIKGRGGSDYGDEAIETLLKLMEDHRDDLVVIVAGYTEPMNLFLDANPGLKSRFNRYLLFEDYTPDQLIQIVRRFCSQSDYVLSPNAEAKLLDLFKMAYASRDQTFGNARDARNIFERATINQSNRIAALERREGAVFQLIDADDIKPLQAMPVHRLGGTTTSG